MVTTYDNFAEFADAVAAHQQANPNWIRLNGLPTTSTRNPWAYFLHADRKWKVDADTSFLPILTAAKHQQETGEFPFTIERTESQDCLVPITAVLNELIRLDETYKKNKYLYIYAPHAK